MARAVYSTCFMAEVSTLGLTVYNVPVGDVAILHDMTVFVHDTHPGSALFPLLSVALDDPGAIVWVLDEPPLRRGIYQWSGREVFSAYMAMTVAGGGFNYSFRANGYLLTPT